MTPSTRPIAHEPALTPRPLEGAVSFRKGTAHAMLRTRTIILTALTTLSLCTLACAPRSSGVEARKEADIRFRRTTSLVSFDQAKQAFESGQLDTARKEIEGAIARSDTEAKYWSLLGRIELESKHLEKSIAAFEKSIACDPTLGEPYYYRGIVHQRWAQSDKAIADYLKAAELDPERVSYLLAAAELMIAARKLDEAREVLLPKLAYFEHNAAMHELLGDVSALSNDPASAARSYERAMIIDGDAPLVGEKLVAALFSAGEWQKCLDAARRQRSAIVTASNGKHADIPNEVLRNEGRSLSMLGRMAEARAVFAEECRTYPECVDAWRDLVRASLETDDLKRAESAADRVIALAKDDADGYTMRSMVASRRGRSDEAVRWSRLAVARAPRDEHALLALGLALRGTGNTAESAKVLAEAMALNPKSEVARRAFVGAAAE